MGLHQTAAVSCSCALARLAGELKSSRGIGSSCGPINCSNQEIEDHVLYNFTDVSMGTRPPCMDLRVSWQPATSVSTHASVTCVSGETLKRNVSLGLCTRYRTRCLSCVIEAELGWEDCLHTVVAASPCCPHLMLPALPPVLLWVDACTESWERRMLKRLSLRPISSHTLCRRRDSPAAQHFPVI